MELEVGRQVVSAGLDLEPDLALDAMVAIRRDPASGELLPPERNGMVLVHSGEDTRPVALRSVGQLFTGDARAPDLSRSPEVYDDFFAAIEGIAAAYCEATHQAPSDDEFVRLYKQLREKPDGWDRSPLFAYLQAAVRLYMSTHEVSKHEFRAVVGRLTKSAKTFRMSKRSCNYYDHVLDRFGGEFVAEDLPPPPW